MRRWTGTTWEPIVDRRKAVICFLVAMGVWFVALWLPAYPVAELSSSEGDGGSVLGLMCALFGLFHGPEGTVAWLGQLGVALTALVAITRRHRSAMWRWWPSALSIGAIVAAILVIGMVVSLDEGGVNKGRVTGLHVGFYVWVMSLLVAATSPHLVREVDVGE